MTRAGPCPMLCSMSERTQHPDTSIGIDLARQRLAHRARRLEAARAALHDRARLYEADGERLPRPLRHAIADFSSALAEVRQQLDGRPSAGSTRRFDGRAA